MNDRDWIIQCIARKNTGRVPYNFMFSPPSERLARKHYGENLEEALSMPIRMTGPGSIKPLYADPEVFGDTITDEFGVVWSTNRIDRGDFECIAVSDDYGTQGGLLISPNHWRRLVKPLLKRIYSAAKSRGLAVFHHSCGHIVPIIPDMIEIGLDILHPIQPEAMDIRFLKRGFGRDVSFSGGVSTQGLLVTGTPEEVRREIKRLKRDMGEGGGYILEPGITIQADVPEENLIALIDEAREPVWL